MRRRRLSRLQQRRTRIDTAPHCLWYALHRYYHEPSKGLGELEDAPFRLDTYR